MHMQQPPFREWDYDQIRACAAGKHSYVYYLKYEAICIHACMCDIVIS